MENKLTFIINNQYVLSRIEENKISKNLKIIQELKQIIDFVIGKNIEVGKAIIDYKVISCKTTCRERWTQDDWTYTFVPKLYILLTISDDYPPSQRFREDTKRKIITCLPKKKDDRIFKLNFENLINELYQL